MSSRSNGIGTDPPIWNSSFGVGIFKTFASAQPLDAAPLHAGLFEVTEVNFEEQFYRFLAMGEYMKNYQNNILFWYSILRDIMDLSPFKRDIDELIDEFAKDESIALADMKRVWLSRKFSYIFEASPSSNLAFFMQSLYAHSIGYVIGNASLSHRLGGLYCLYCLYETQPFKPPFRIYLSLDEVRDPCGVNLRKYTNGGLGEILKLIGFDVVTGVKIGELKKLASLVVDAKAKGLEVVLTLVRLMLEKNMFLFGSVEINVGSVTETVTQLTELQNARIHVAYNTLFANTRIEHFLHMDLTMGARSVLGILSRGNCLQWSLNPWHLLPGVEVDLNVVQNMSTEYAEAKKLAIGASSSCARTVARLELEAVYGGGFLSFKFSRDRGFLMSFTRSFRVEAKEFHVSVSVGGVVKLTEWSRKSVSAISFGKYGAVWVINMGERLMAANGDSSFVSKANDYSQALLAQRCVNKAGRYVAILEYGEGRRRGVVMVPEGKGGEGWRLLTGVFQEVVDHLSRVNGGKVGQRVSGHQG
ncbi:hypothetical protein CJ030_MR7G014282 [Morella rubra]|uniref:Uncharacterized protein n=1 Tax=Morella rubra TaxID=262757 RepID=A0A6A1V2N8_9ROSI|nr:hypothetical protein CJ030_MR7G014282 [Morella rubra]